jgi:hypothetical protein
VRVPLPAGLNAAESTVPLQSLAEQPLPNAQH